MAEITRDSIYQDTLLLAGKNAGIQTKQPVDELARVWLILDILHRQATASVLRL